MKYFRKANIDIRFMLGDSIKYWAPPPQEQTVT